MLERKSKDRLELTSDMSRQYKSMQTDMVARVGSLEAQVADLNGRLGRVSNIFAPVLCDGTVPSCYMFIHAYLRLATAQTALQDAAREHERTLAEKDTLIEDQQVKMSYMSQEFEAMLNVGAPLL